MIWSNLVSPSSTTHSNQRALRASAGSVSFNQDGLTTPTSEARLAFRGPLLHQLAPCPGISHLAFHFLISNPRKFNWMICKVLSVYSRTAERLRFCANCKQTHEPATVSWMLEEDTRAQVRDQGHYCWYSAAVSMSFIFIPDCKQSCLTFGVDVILLDSKQT